MADGRIFTTKSGAIKMCALLCLVVAMATFFSAHRITESDKSATYFITSMIVSPFLHTMFLLIVYTFGGLAIQKTLFEFMVNSFYTFMLSVAAIVLFVLSNRDSGAIASGIFLLFAAACYGADCYFALLNMGAFDRPGVDEVPAPTQYPPTVIVPEQRSQPFTPPPTYNPPPGLAGQGPYSLPQQGGTINSTGDLGQRI